MRRSNQDFMVPDKSVCIGDVKTVFQYRSWLNNEAISSYMQLIGERDPIKVYAFNTYFYSLLSTCGYDAVESWEFPKDLFDYDRVLIPVHEKFHWSLVCVHFNEKSIKYYDSLKRTNMRCVKLVLDYLTMASWKRTRNEFNSDEWQLFHAEDCPKQFNSDDCGVFTCINAEYLARGVKLNFSQSDIRKFRHRICYEILTNRLLFSLDDSQPRSHG
uniref:Sentrin-specific protease 1 n=1 Tax=Sipha flava TaxID=143950 RepID=A0A2S2PWN3_9HEMI